MYEKRNQTYTMHPDFFDPLHKSARLEMKPGDPEFVQVKYYDEEASVTVPVYAYVKSVQFCIHKIVFHNCLTKSTHQEEVRNEVADRIGYTWFGLLLQEAVGDV